MKKRLLTSILVLIFSFLILIPSFALDEAVAEAPYEGYSIATSNDRFVLYYKTDMASIAVLDKASGKTWHSQLPADQIPAGVLERSIQEFNSLLVLKYSKLNKLSKDVSEDPIESLEYDINTEMISGGIEYDIKIKSLNLSFSVDILLNEDGIDFLIPDDKIIEGDGTTQVLNEKLDIIQKSIDSLIQECETMKNDKSLSSGVTGGFKTAINKFNELKEYIKTIKNIVDMESIGEEIIEMLNNIQSITTDAYSKIKSEDYKSKQKTFDQNLSSLKIKISSLKIIEAASIVSIKVMPYFGACNDDVNGYMLYPDGSGAITEFKKKHGRFSSEFASDVFSPQIPNIEDEKAMDSVGLKRTNMPYYGVKQDNAAFIAYVAEGENESNINFSPSGNSYNINRTSSSFIYRKLVPKVIKVGNWTGGEDYAYEIEKAVLNAKVKFMFLANEEANYSGMAKKLSNYLHSINLLTKNKILSEGVPLSLDLLGGYNQKILVFNNYVPATTFKQAEQIIKDITGDKKIPLLINYKGFLQTGYDIYPSTNKIASDLGGMNGLKELASFAKEKGGYLFLQDNHVEIQVSTGRYNEGDFALGSNMKTIQNTDKNLFLLSPAKVFSNIKNSIVPFLKETGAYGITEDRIGTFVYYNYKKTSKSTRTQTIETWQNILKYEKEQLGGSAVIGGNQYVFDTADWILDAPVGTSGYIYTDYAVPFYQMVIHGYIPYTSGAFNQFYDKKLQLLQAIEYGNLPYYKLTYNDIDTTEVSTYTSKYSQFYDEIIDTYNLYSKDLTGIMDKQIIKHTRDGDLVTVEYSDNTVIHINYGNTEIVKDGYTVAPMNYHISKSVGGEILEKQVDVVSKGESNGVHLYNTLGYWILFVLLVPIVLFVGVILFANYRSGNLQIGVRKVQ